ncbi:MAG: hypothetical protein QOD75_2142, partial [Blastocatellia bacterium]|nr:hypothetical protein [Blastocatellia bacterium]
EGAPLPMLYNKYVGHDDNRDWYAFTQIETQIAVDKIHNVWHPQIVHDIHQQGENGSRLFLPPYMQPVEPNVPKQIVEDYTELGHAMAADMRAAGFKGITTDSTYDAWTPARAYSHYHGGVRILSETASCKIATPITVKFEELNSRDPGYDPKKESPNFGPVWQGGEWHLRDITNYMTGAAFSLLKHAAQDRERWLQRFYEIGKEAVRPRKRGELAGFVFNWDSQPATAGENGKRLVETLQRAGVEVKQELLSGFYLRTCVSLKIAQPYGSFGKALLEAQHYPDLRDSSGHPIPPYDVTAHSLGLLSGIKVEPVFAPFRDSASNGSLKLARPSDPYHVKDIRFALYRSHTPSMDEGWTRWILERQFSEPMRYRSLEDANVRAGNLHANYDVIIIPDQARNAILNGHRKGVLPDEYTGGLGAEGVKALGEFVEQGGTLICLNRASDFAIEQFKLPIRNVVDGLPRTDFFVPGSILRIELDTTNPIAAGMPKESIAWVENSPVFEVGQALLPVPSRTGASNVKVIAWYPRDKDPLLSGWLLGGERIKGKAALVEVTLGKGRIILFGFRPQYRGQSLATYPLFFNAITNR